MLSAIFYYGALAIGMAFMGGLILVGFIGFAAFILEYTRILATVAFRFFVRL